MAVIVANASIERTLDIVFRKKWMKLSNGHSLGNQIPYVKFLILARWGGLMVLENTTHRGSIPHSQLNRLDSFVISQKTLILFAKVKLFDSF